MADVEWHTAAKKLRDQRGFSLVEILVAAILLGLVVIAMIAMVQKGREMEISSDHRRQARAYIHAAFENDNFHFLKYQLIGPALDTSYSVNLDPQESTPLPAIMDIKASVEQGVSADDGNSVPYKSVTVTMVWQEPEGPDTVQVVKLISNAK